MSNEPMPASAAGSAGRWPPSPSWSSSPRPEWSPPTANAKRPSRSVVTAAAGALVSRSEVLRSGQGDVAALLAVEAHRIAPSAITESALFGIFTVRDDAAADPADRRKRLVRRRRRLRAEQRHRGDCRPPGTRPPRRCRRRFGHASLQRSTTRNGYTEVAVSADGRYLAGLWRPQVQQDHSMLTVWDLQTNEQRFEPVRIDHVSRSVTISDDGSHVVVAGGPLGDDPGARRGVGCVCNWSSTRCPSRPPGADSADTESVLFAPDGRLAVVSRTGVIRLIDVATGAELQRLDGRPGGCRGGSLVQSGRFGTRHCRVLRVRRLGRRRSPRCCRRCDDRDVRCRMIVYAEFIDAVLCPTGTGPVIAFDARERQRDPTVRRTTGRGLRHRGESRWNEVRQGDVMCRVAPEHSSSSGASTVPGRSATRLPHFVTALRRAVRVRR